jgi:hypothetical protein
MPFEKGNKYRFGKDRQPTKRGGPVKLSSQIATIPADAQKRMYAILHKATTFNSKDEAIKYFKEEKDKGEYGFILELAINALYGKNGWQVLMDIMDRLFGKPRQINENYNDNTERNKATVIFVKDNEEE